MRTKVRLCTTKNGNHKVYQRRWIDPLTHKRHCKTLGKTSEMTKRDALAKCGEFEDEIAPDQQTAHVPERMTLGDFRPLYLERRLRPSVSVSALQRIGLDRLLAEVQSLLDQSRPMVWLRFDYKSYREINRLQTQGTIHETVHLDNGIYVHASLPPRLLKRYEKHRASAPPAPVAQAES